MATVGSIVVRIYGDLRFFVGNNCDGPLEVPSGVPRSVKDLVEAVGVPHPEVGIAAVQR
jgi:Mut7-C ubiquitin